MDISIIVPCYNHGSYLRDAVYSVTDLEHLQFEIIVVNDGSTDAFTLQVLNELEGEGFLVIHQSNLGLAAARNVGIARAGGRYIIPLDSDNRLDPVGLLKALEILDRNEADIVYGNPDFFGEEDVSRLFHPKNFDVYEIFKDNYIDACAIFRRIVWETNGGYETNMPFPGHEDWEFWINAYSNGFRFEYLNMRFFYYRVLKNSMITQTNQEGRYLLNHQFIITKHFQLHQFLFRNLNSLRKKIVFDIDHPFRTAIKFFLIWLRLKK